MKPFFYFVKNLRGIEKEHHPNDKTNIEDKNYHYLL